MEPWLRSAAALLGGRRAPEVHVRSGTVIAGRYRVEACIGIGGMAVVYRAEDLELARRVAIKIYDRDSLEPKLSRIAHEARAIAALSHPNVIVVFDVGAHEGRLFAAMEYVEGGTLRGWLRARPGWRAVVDAFVACGRGLAAAHAIGVVHRDFKPDNVLLGRDMRPRIADFGLACGHAAPGATDDGTSGIQTPPSATTVLAGTPHYIAPEQYRGEPPDPRSDQFAFCVALFEALYGVHPFVGVTAAEIVRSIRLGIQRDPPGPGDVPDWLHRIVMRGLEQDPQRRHPDMHRLVAALHRGPRRNRHWITALAIAGVAAVLVLAPGDTESVCATGDATIADAWNETQRARIADAFDRTRSPLRDSALAEVEDGIDRWTGTWRAQFAAVCSQRRDETLPIEAVDRRVQCLARRATELRGVLEAFADAQRDTIARTRDVLDVLPPLDRCADDDRLSTAAAQPLDPQLSASIELAREQIARGHAELEQGRFGDARELAIVARDAATQYAPVHAEAELLLGVALVRADDLDEGGEILEDLFLRAVERGDDEIAARAARELLCSAGTASHDTARAEHWARTAIAANERANASTREDVELRSCLAASYDRPDERARAETMLREALAQTDPAWADGVVEARLRDRLGGVLAGMERHAEALGEYEQAYALALAARGPAHPTTLAMRGNLARMTSELGRPGEAVAMHIDNLQTIVATLGADSPQLLQTYLDLATALARAGAAPQAVAYLESGVELARTRPDQARRTMLLLGSLAYHMTVQGNLPRAIALYREAIDVAESAFGRETRQAGIARGNLASALATAGRGHEALAEFVYAREVLVAADGPTHPRIGMLHANIARLANELGEHALVDEHLAAAEEIAVINRDTRLEMGLLATRVNVLRRRGELTQARDIQRRVVELSEPLDSSEYRRALFDLGCIEREVGRPRAALVALEQAYGLAVARDTAAWRLAEIEYELGLADWDAGNHARARQWVERAVRGWQADADDEVAESRAEHLAEAQAWLRDHPASR